MTPDVEVLGAWDLNVARPIYAAFEFFSQRSWPATDELNRETFHRHNTASISQCKSASAIPQREEVIIPCDDITFIPLSDAEGRISWCIASSSAPIVM